MSTPAAESTDVTMRSAGNPPDDPEITARDNVSAGSPGDFLAVVEPSDCGKITILNLLAGLPSATSSRIERRRIDSYIQRNGRVGESPR